MANYESCKVYIRQVKGIFDVETIKQKVIEFQKEYRKRRFMCDARAYICIEEQALEVRYSGKPLIEIDKFFESDEFEIFMLTADEGGARDTFSFLHEGHNYIHYLESKMALYQVNQVEIYGDVDKIIENLPEIFGRHIEYHSKTDELVRLSLKGTYASSNYICNDDRADVSFEFTDSLPYMDDFVESDSLEIIGLAKFQESFYDKVLIYGSKGKNLFPYIQSIKFKYEGRITNIIERVDDHEYDGWRHTASNNFQNLMNTEIIFYRENIDKS